MNKNLIVSIVVGLAIFFCAQLRSHLTNEAWAVSPDQIATAAKKGAFVQSANGGITGRAIQRSNAHLLKYKWLIMGMLAGLACFHFLRRGLSPMNAFDFSWRKERFYWRLKDFPELADWPEAQAKGRLAALQKKHASLGLRQELAHAKEHFAAHALMLVAFQLVFGFDMGLGLFLAAFLSTCWLRSMGQRVPLAIRAELQAEKGSVGGT